MLAEQVRIGGEIDLFAVGYELSERYGLTDEEFLSAKSLGELTRAVANRLAPAADREVRAAKVVADTARRIAPLLLREDGPAVRLARLRLAYSKHSEPPDGPLHLSNKQLP